MVLLSIAYILCFNLVHITSHFDEPEEPPNLLLISFDGFRHDYINMARAKGISTPNFDLVIKNGASSKLGLKNAFITKTFPNHYTLVTGLWVESHGIVANTMYDPHLKKEFTLSNKEEQRSAKWFDNGGEPIWVTNQLQNFEHRSGSIMFPGGSAPVKGVLTTRNIFFDPDIKNETRVNTIIDWFTSEYPINLGLLYFEEPDQFGHQFGPNSPQVAKMIGGIDDVLGYLIKQLKEKDLFERTNIIITSDHGFSSTPPDKIINLDEYIDPTMYRIFASNPIANILPNEGKLDELYSKLKEASQKQNHFTVYKKEDIPDRYHYKDNDRIMPLLVVTDEHWQLSYNGSVITELGTHGWDNALLDMHPFFLAIGPSFKPGSSIEVMNSVDVYPLMCHLLGLKEAPNNGSITAALPLLKTHKDDENAVITFGTYILILILIALVAGLFMVAACRQHRYLKRKQKQMLPLTALQRSVRYSTPPNGAKIPLLSDTDDDEDIILN